MKTATISLTSAKSCSLSLEQFTEILQVTGYKVDQIETSNARFNARVFVERRSTKPCQVHGTTNLGKLELSGSAYKFAIARLLCSMGYLLQNEDRPSVALSLLHLRLSSPVLDVIESIEGGIGCDRFDQKTRAGLEEVFQSHPGLILSKTLASPKVRAYIGGIDERPYLGLTVTDMSYEQWKASELKKTLDNAFSMFEPSW